MSMEINGSGSHARINYADRLKEEQAPDRTEKEVKKAEDGAKAVGQKAEPHDEYISSERSGTKPSGLYHVGQDENGNRKIYYDDPKKADKADGQENPRVKPEDSEEGNDGAPKAKAGQPEDAEEKCVGNTDQVDREIRELKAKKQQLEQQLQSAEGDDGKVKDLEKKLAQVESELSRKDNDTYRKQYSRFTNL